MTLKLDHGRSRWHNSISHISLEQEQGEVTGSDVCSNNVCLVWFLRYSTLNNGVP